MSGYIRSHCAAGECNVEPATIGSDDCFHFAVHGDNWQKKQQIYVPVDQWEICTV